MTDVPQGGGEKQLHKSKSALDFKATLNAQGFLKGMITLSARPPGQSFPLKP